MDLAAVFAGLDRIAWPELPHAHGPAEDVPDLLRALSGADREAAEEAERELWSSIVHQGTVYGATVAAVPFLARLAAAGVRCTGLLVMVGAIAESTDEHDVEPPGAARAAVVAQLPLLLPLLADGDPEVRQWAAWAVAQCGPGAGADARGALRRRWEAEADPVVRADVLTACVLVDPEAADQLRATALRAAEPPSVRVAALLAGVDAGLPWDGRLADTVVALTPLARHTEGSRWERQPLKALALRLHARGDVDGAIEAVASALRRAVAAVRAGADTGTAVVAEATGAARSLVLRSRTAPARLLPEMLPLLDTPATAGDVMDAVRDWAQPVPEASTALVRLAEGTGEWADRALAALVSQGAPEASDLLARHLTERPRALEAAFDRTTGRQSAPLPCTPALLDAVRARLAALTAEAAAPDAHQRPRRSPAVAGGLAALNEPVHLAGLLAGWEAGARAAIPELVAALPHHPFPVGRALAAVADARLHPEAVTALRACAETGPRADRKAAASALHSLTGDAGPLLAVLEPALGEANGRRDSYVEAAAALGEQARPLLPRLLAVLAEPAETRATVPPVRAALTAAGAVWELTGDQDAVLPMILEGLAWAPRPWGHQVASQAAGLAALLGPAARPAVPHLLPLLDRADTAAAAVRALVAADPGSDRPGGVPLTDLVDRVLRALEPGAYPHSALPALEALAALGPGAFTPDQLARVRAIADGDRRVVGSGSHTRIVRDDEELRAVARRVPADPAR
ncbi:hypothetical protein ACIG0D_12715 [Streptomyces sp. NPDC052773]|uniref:hypothetical protein n=1 Tax=Streptomyces sp. NPDC052773 TaxID=3365693 RepID=UPI0037D7F12C